jgi:hypothetical protein
MPDFRAFVRQNLQLPYVPGADEPASSRNSRSISRTVTSAKFRKVLIRKMPGEESRQRRTGPES